MILRDEFPSLADWRIEIVGTDLSPTIIERAKEAVYTTFEVQRGLPIQLLLKHFEQIDDRWRIKDELRRRVSFRIGNLLEDLRALGTFDVVFCRNVLIYFDRDTKARVLAAIGARLAADGALILGGAESVFGITTLFAEIHGLRGVYAHVDAETNFAVSSNRSLHILRPAATGVSKVA